MFNWLSNTTPTWLPNAFQLALRAIRPILPYLSLIGNCKKSKAVGLTYGIIIDFLCISAQPSDLWAKPDKHEKTTQTITHLATQHIEIIQRERKRATVTQNTAHLHYATTSLFPSCLVPFTFPPFRPRLAAVPCLPAEQPSQPSFGLHDPPPTCAAVPPGDAFVRIATTRPRTDSRRPLGVHAAAPLPQSKWKEGVSIGSV